MYAELERPGIWRVDAIGGLHLSTSEDSRVDIFLSEIHDWAKLNPFKRQSDTGNSISLSVTNAAIFHFVPGTLWSGGERVGRVSEPLGTFSIDTLDSQQIRFSDPFHFRGCQIQEALPDSYIRFANRSSLAKTWLHIVPVKKDERTQILIIPAAEIFRFYYGVSTRLIRQIFRGNISTVMEWGESKVSNREVHIIANTKLRDAEAVVLARAKCWEQVHNPLFMPWQACALAMANRTDATIKSAFPFMGPTRLQVIGKRIPLRDDKGKRIWAVYVSEIVHCQRDLEFEKIVVTLNQHLQRQCSRDTNAESLYSRPWLHADPFDTSFESPVIDEPADASITRDWFKRQSNRFADGASPRIVTLLEEIPSSVPALAYSQETSINNMTLQSGNHSKSGRHRLGLDWIDYAPEKVAPVLGRFLSVMQHVQRTMNQSWSVDCRSFFSARSVSLDKVTTFPTLKGSRYSWHFLPCEVDGFRLRQVAWIEIVHRETKQYLYALEMEISDSEGGQCTLIFHRTDYTCMRDRDMIQLLRLTIVKNRWPFPNSQWRKKSHKHVAEKLFRDFRFIRLAHRTSIKGQCEQPTELAYIEARSQQIAVCLTSALGFTNE